jgi:hypothetical protein
MPFRSVAEVADAVEQGRHHIQHFIRTSVNGGFGSGPFGDASVGSGLPSYNPYLGAPLEATPLIGQRNNSIYVGPTGVSERYLLRVSMTHAGTAGFLPSIYFLDYLLFYSYIDLDSTDQQDLTNDVTLPRYADGEGVRMMMLMQTPGVGTATNITINYTNSAGVAKTLTAAYRSSGAIGCIGSSVNTNFSALGPFFPLANGDRGVRSVQSVQLAAGVGGFAAMVLVKPLFTMSANEFPSTVEKDFLREQAALPRILDGAFLNYIFNLSTNTSSLVPLVGQAQFVWTGEPPTAISSTVEYLVVAGGGGGGSGDGGGGGAGGFRTGTDFVALPNTAYPVTVGTGGTGGTASVATNGQASTLSLITSVGGGAGGSYVGTGRGALGGSGGGGASGLVGGAGTSGHGTAGGNGAGSGINAGGGGGGAGAVGANGAGTGPAPIGGNGGAGLASSITGSSITYAGGGGGGISGIGTRGSGGAGGGGIGGDGDGNPPVAGTANTGGGGGGGGSDSSPQDLDGANGGSGVVIIAYPDTLPSLSSISGGLTYTLDTVGRPGFKIYRFTAGTGLIQW